MTKLYIFRLNGFRAYWDTYTKEWVAEREETKITAKTREEIYSKIENYGK